MARKPYSFINPNGTVGCQIFRVDQSVMEECVNNLQVLSSKKGSEEGYHDGEGEARL
ncbi:hypothetical protein CERZMDRAFT_103364 [Cercospora zeae-maydis SCOH1-5]|uniref:Uncharacterized protein n=1 Tax=Cercospora zeae-maydis SCOH1-5 TaxID=717836 RepID=A0A6A6F1Q3_9PEZI|nr:hypothetical protein CERZMDRAFT_103364 [Cercospora zeae-maydis SCOH1-5]